MDIYVVEEKFKQSVINKTKGQIITEDAENMKDKNTLDQCWQTASVSLIRSEEVQRSIYSMQAQSYYRIAIAKLWNLLCWERKQQGNFRRMVISIKTV